MMPAGTSKEVEGFFQCSRVLRQTMRYHGTFLVVDDDQDSSGIVKELLTRSGRSVRSLQSLIAAKEAIEEIGHENVACIILDVMFPVDSGVAFAYWLHTTYPDIPFFVYTCAKKSWVRDALNYVGVSAQVVEKNGSLAELVDALGLQLGAAV